MKKKLLLVTVVLIMLLTMTTVILTSCGDKEYKITVYDVDGTTVLETFTLKKGASLSKKDLTFEKEGYTFDAVYLDAEFTSKYEPSEVTTNVNLYARFTQDTQYISFVNEGGEDIARIEVKKGEAFELPTPDARTGYTFNGWLLDGEAFDDDQPYDMNTSIRLRADWSANVTAVTYDANGGSLLSQGAASFTYGQSVLLPVVQRDGYNFGGWAKDSDTTAYAFGNTWQVDAATVSFKAIWTARITKVIFALNGGELSTQLDKDGEDNYYMNIAYDASYTLPVASKAGYTLSWVEHGTTNGVAATGTWSKTTANLSLVAEWTANPYRVLLDAKTGTCDTEYKNTLFNSEIGILPVPNAPTGYVFDGWYYTDNGVDKKINATTLHTAVGNISAFAKYSKDTDITYTVEIYLENPNDDGFSKFDTLIKRGVTDAAIDAENDYSPEAYMIYDTANANNVKTGTIAANGSTVLKMYFKRAEYTISVNEQGGNAVSDITAKFGAAITVPTLTRTGYSFNAWDKTFPATMPLNGVTMTASWTANTYRLYLDVTLGNSYLAADGVSFDNGKPYIEVAYDASNYNVPVTVNGDYSFVGWKLATDDSDFSVATAWKVLGNQSVYAVWAKATAEEFIVDKTNKIIREYDGNEYVYVFVKGFTPNFGTGATIEVSGEANLVAGNLDCSATVEAFTIKITSANGRVRTVKGTIVEDVTVFDAGTSYTSNWTNRNDDNFLDQDDATKAVMQVGNANGIKPDVVVKGVGSVELSLDVANIDIELVYKSGANANERVDETLYSVVNDELLLDDVLVGRELTLTLIPRYYLAEGAAPVATFELVVNNGVNVYDSATFKAAYEDNSVKTVNVLRNFDVVITPDKYGDNNGQSYLINDFNFCAYVRYATEAEVFTVNCNYFTVNGANLEYFDNRYDGYDFMGEAAAINNVQSAIFGYSGRSRQGVSFPNAKLVINDMYLQGNNTKEAAFTDANASDGKPIYKMSGAFNGIRVQNCGVLEFNNSTIKNTLIAIYGHAANGQCTLAGSEYVTSTKLDLNYVMTDNSWANSVYVWGNSNVDISNSRILSSSGAAVHVEDHFDPNYSGKNTVNIDTATVIANYVTGEEAWFVAYGMNAMIPSLKTQLDGAAQLVTATASSNTVVKGIIKNDGAEYFNFAIFSRSAGGESSDWQTDPQGSVDFTAQYNGSPLTLTTIAEGTDATITTDFKYIIFNTSAPGVGEVFFFVTLE